MTIYKLSILHTCRELRPSVQPSGRLSCQRSWHVIPDENRFAVCLFLFVFCYINHWGIKTNYTANRLDLYRQQHTRIIISSELNCIEFHSIHMEYLRNTPTKLKGETRADWPWDPNNGRTVYNSVSLAKTYTVWTEIAMRVLSTCFGWLDWQTFGWMNGWTGVCVGLVFEWIYLVTLLY